jgi:DNA-binding NtrC family response regulator
MPDVLILDDEQDICWALEVALRGEGFRITQVGRGEEAIREVAARRFDAAIIDVKLPGKSGLAVSEALRQLDPGLKIVMISGYHYEEDQPIQEGIRRGNYQGFISKPFELDQVSVLLRQVIGEGRESPRATNRASPPAWRPSHGEGGRGAGQTERR